MDFVWERMVIIINRKKRLALFKNDFLGFGHIHKQLLREDGNRGILLCQI